MKGKKTGVFLALLLWLAPAGHAQQDSVLEAKQILNRGHLIAGLSFAGYSLWIEQPGPQPDTRAWLYEFKPSLGIMFTRHLAAGLTGSLGNSGGNVLPGGRLYSAGAYARFYPFMGQREALLTRGTFVPRHSFSLAAKLNPRSRAFLAVSVFPFAEAGVQFTNYVPDSTGFHLEPKLSQPWVYAGAGLNLRLVKRLSVAFSFRQYYLPGAQKPFDWPRIAAQTSLEYFIPTRDRKPVPGAYLKTWPHPGQTHEKGISWPDSGKYSPRLTFGASFTYIWSSPPEFFKEYTTSINVAFSPLRRLYFGFNYLNIRFKPTVQTDDRAHLAGLFVNYQIAQDSRLTFTPQVGFYLGNYCTCGDTTNPYVRSGLSYLEVGAGFGYALTRALQFEFSFLVYNNLQDIPEKYSYTQYILGLNYEFRLRKK